MNKEKLLKKLSNYSNKPTPKDKAIVEEFSNITEAIVEVNNLY